MYEEIPSSQGFCLKKQCVTDIISSYCKCVNKHRALVMFQ